MMQPISYKRHRFPPDIIRLGIWLYYRFTLTLGLEALHLSLSSSHWKMRILDPVVVA